MTHRFHKARIYYFNSYRNPVGGGVEANALVGSMFNSNKEVSLDGYPSNICDP